MLIKSLVIAFLATIAVAELPSYIKVCGRRNPKLDQCVIDSVESMRDKLRTGIPELEVPPLEPLELSDLALSDTETLRVFVKNVKLSGLTDFQIKSFHDDLKNMTFTLEAIFKKVIIDADYDVKAKIVLPLNGKGPIHIVSEDVYSFSVINYKLVTKNGVKYVFVPSMTTQLKIKDYQADFKVEGDTDNTLAKAISAAIEGGRQEILEVLTPSLEKTICEKVLQIANQILKHFTYDELHPDTE